MKVYITFLAGFAVVISGVAAASIVGIGLELKEKRLDEPAIVRQVVPASPAWKAGIKADFIILSIDGANTAGKSTSDCVSLIRGAPKTSVTLKVVDGGVQRTNKLTVKRETIMLE